MKLKEQFSKFHNNIKTTLESELKEKRTMFENEIKNKFQSYSYMWYNLYRIRSILEYYNK